MPFNKASYDKKFNARPAEKKKRAARNAARRKVTKTRGAAAVRGKDVDHKRSLSNGGSNKASNLRVVSKKVNRGKKRVADQKARRGK